MLFEHGGADIVLYQLPDMVDISHELRRPLDGERAWAR
jgi:hypothetical protein